MSWHLALVVRILLVVARTVARAVGEDELVTELRHLSNMIGVEARANDPKAVARATEAVLLHPDAAPSAAEVRRQKAQP